MVGMGSDLLGAQRTGLSGVPGVGVHLRGAETWTCMVSTGREAARCPGSPPHWKGESTQPPTPVGTSWVSDRSGHPDILLRAAGVAPRVEPGTAHALCPAELGGSHGRSEAPGGLEDSSQGAGEAVALSPAHGHADLIPDPQGPQGGSWRGKGAGEGHREARGWR